MTRFCQYYLLLFFMILVKDIMDFISLLGVKLDASVNFFSGVMMKFLSVARC